MLAVAPVDGVALVRRLLGAALLKSTDVAAQLHPAWVEAAWQRAGMAAPPARPLPGSAELLAATYGLQWASLAGFAHRTDRLALLPRPELLRVLAAVALHGERDRVRHSIGRGLRAAIIERVGEVAYAGIVAAAVDGSPRAAGGLAMADLEPDKLAKSGFAALREHGHWRSTGALAWVRLALAPEENKRTPATRASDVAGALQRLSLYFPEHAWLFGFPMDRALSASTKA